jgi:hypothetical protein
VEAIQFSGKRMAGGNFDLEEKEMPAGQIKNQPLVPP